MDTKICSKCSEKRPISEFNWNRHKNCYNSQCLSCRYKEQRRRNSTKEGRIKFCVGKAKCRNKEFSLSAAEATVVWDKQKGICALSGLPLATECDSPYTASLDRIDSTKGYTADNIQWVCWAVNKLKQDLDEDLLIALCGAIADYTRK